MERKRTVTTVIYFIEPRPSLICWAEEDHCFSLSLFFIFSFSSCPLPALFSPLLPHFFHFSLMDFFQSKKFGEKKRTGERVLSRLDILFPVQFSGWDLGPFTLFCVLYEKFSVHPLSFQSISPSTLCVSILWQKTLMQRFPVREREREERIVHHKLFQFAKGQRKRKEKGEIEQSLGRGMSQS